MTVQVRSTTRRARRSKAAKQDMILQLHSGPHAGKHLVRIPNGRDDKGRLKYKHYGPFADLNDAIAARDKHNKALAEQRVEVLPVGRQAKPMTLRQWTINHWLLDIRNSAASSTAHRYAFTMQRYVLDGPDGVRGLGEYALVDLTAERIVQLREDLKAAGVGSPTIRYALKRLKTCLSAAVIARRTTGLTENPASTVKGVRLGRKEEHQGSPLEYPRLIAAAGEHHLAAAIPFTVDSGGRVSEVVAARWGDIDFERRLWTVRWHMIQSGSFKRGDRIAALVPGAKTSKGEYLTVRLSRRTIEVLTAHRERLRRLQGPGWKTGKAGSYFVAEHSGSTSGPAYVVPTDPGADGALIFPRANGLPLATIDMSGWFTRVCEVAGVVKTFHGMRHDCGSFMLADGVPLTVVSKHLRHANTAITAEVYAHQLREQESLGADTMDALWARIEAQEQAV